MKIRRFSTQYGSSKSNFPSHDVRLYRRVHWHAPLGNTQTQPLATFLPAFTAVSWNTNYIYPLFPYSFYMFTQFLSCFNVLASTARSHFPPHQTQFSSNFTVTHNSKRRVVVFVRSMASNDQKFPPQKQETQPGKEHLMDPTPQFASLEYKPANKLRVFT